MDIGQLGDFSMERDRFMGDLVLGKLKEEYITDPDLCDILSTTPLEPHRMSRFEDEELLLITSVIYSEMLELQGERKREVFTLYN